MEDWMQNAQVVQSYTPSSAGSKHITQREREKERERRDVEFIPVVCIIALRTLHHDHCNCYE